MISSGRALVVTSQSFGSLRINKSLTQPPTRHASKPASFNFPVTRETSSGILNFSIFALLDMFFVLAPRSTEQSEVRSGAPGGIRTPNKCFEGIHDIHFTTGA